MPVLVGKRRQVYLRKLNALNAKCKKCIKQGRFVSNDRCDICHIGKAVRRLETEYADITGWTHNKW